MRTDRVEGFKTSSDGGAVFGLAALHVQQLMEDDVDEQRQPRHVLHRQDEERLQRQALSLGSTLQRRQRHQELRLLPAGTINSIQPNPPQWIAVRPHYEFGIHFNLQRFDAVGWAAGRASGL